MKLVLDDVIVESHCVNLRGGRHVRDVQMRNSESELRLRIPVVVPSVFTPTGRYRVTVELVSDPCECGADTQPEGLDDGHSVGCKAALRAEMRKLIREEMKK